MSLGRISGTNGKTGRSFLMTSNTFSRFSWGNSKIAALLRLAFLCAIMAASPASAQHTYSQAVQRACVNDYEQHCREYGIETEALRLCMDKAGLKLTKTCLDALIADGEITKQEVERRQHGGN